ncbi:Sec-independent protein translocase TatB [Sorangium cellulosum]|uniref:Sec-independent protein translocase protein TatB homolog n=1 Tax=Sorangium cellulosum TaxID=56 RepID=A0A2L0EVD7_SORCE|nr:Sec-independent protein translocase protein TatB [Sorangium cellulosum]AUX43242.1 Sec-independent protein translocase TatB [Sorangium cellulosum]
MFGFSFGEIVVLVIVGLVVVGPRRLPAMMRSAGGWIAKLRRMTTELRSQSGIDDLIRQEGLEREIRELRALSRVNVIETLVKPVVDAASVGTVVSATPRIRPPEPEPEPEPMVQPLREREYPVLGCDAYGAEIEGEASGASRPAAAQDPAAEAAPAAAAEVAVATAPAAVTEAAVATAPAAVTEAAVATAPAATTEAAAGKDPAAAVPAVTAEPAAAPQGAAAASGAAS